MSDSGGLPFLEPGREGTYIRVHVQPGSSREGIAGLHGGSLRVRLRARPVEGAANRTLVALLAGTLGVKKSALSITGGRGSRDKRVFVQGMDAASLERALRESHGDLFGGGV